MLGFYKELIESNKLKVINTCDEQGAAFAAGYRAESNNYNAMHFSAIKDQRITVKRLFERINFSMTPNVIVIADVGDSLFGSLDLTIRGHAHFLSPAYYLSVGFAVPAAIGAQLANPKLRHIVVVGDGAFQMTGMEISTISRFGLNPLVPQHLHLLVCEHTPPLHHAVHQTLH